MLQGLGIIGMVTRYQILRNYMIKNSSKTTPSRHGKLCKNKSRNDKCFNRLKGYSHSLHLRYTCTHRAIYTGLSSGCLQCLLVVLDGGGEFRVSVVYLLLSIKLGIIVRVVVLVTKGDIPDSGHFFLEVHRRQLPRFSGVVDERCPSPVD